MVLLGYLFGEGDMDRTMYISTAGGYDSDCNPSSACGVLGVQLGAKGLGENVFYHVRQGPHDLAPSDWESYMNALEK